MSLRQEQCAFTVDCMKLFVWLYEHSYEWSFGEAWRTPEQQAIYLQAGKSKTMNSFHLKRLAIDLNIFKDGRLLATKEEMQTIGNAWESMCAQNTWGGNWKNFKDIPHFERTVK